ncbi:hypothetical protein F1880_001405 [Penicillium rolfsii]|nr:hypothetical protein F1880_001405 [Penicillium rolfsii]
MSPFVRARAPELEQRYGLPSSDLLAFIDGLNEAFMVNPAMQVTNTIGSIVGLVPLQSTQIIGASLNLAAGIGSAGISIVRTKRYMKKANETIFKPKGLHAQICKTEKMLGQIGWGFDTAVFEKSMLSSAQTNEPSKSAIERRMAALGDCVMRLSFEHVEAPVAPENWAKKISSFATQRAEKKQLEKLEKQQAKADEKVEKAGRKISRAEQKQRSVDGEMDKIMKDMDDVQYQIQCLNPNSRRHEKHLRELQREYRQLERKFDNYEEKRMSRQAKQVDKHGRQRHEKTMERERKDAKKINKIYWVMISAEDHSALGDEDWASDENSEKSAEYETAHHEP